MSGYVTEHKRDVERGWHPLLDELHSELAEIDPQYSTGQVKEKFGGLRVYLDGWTKEDTPEGEAARQRHHQLYEVIRQYEHKSVWICEYCGEPGQLRTHRSWWKTLCDQCSADRDAGKRTPSWERWLAEAKERGPITGPGSGDG